MYIHRTIKITKDILAEKLKTAPFYDSRVTKRLSYTYFPSTLSGSGNCKIRIRILPQTGFYPCVRGWGLGASSSNGAVSRMRSGDPAAEKQRWRAGRASSQPGQVSPINQSIQFPHQHASCGHSFIHWLCSYSPYVNSPYEHSQWIHSKYIDLHVIIWTCIH